ncbi:aldo/keto reductase [Plantactinospora sp. CA-294935]|uniref:aldo/keto reductase n=1 Tax=Plantactinospora sp. CA-294935 TaxID=3240012 RepID=UPI003D944178
MTSAIDQPTVTLPSEVRMPMLGFGTWQLRGRRAYDAVREALDVGYRHLDTATMYGNEDEVGRAIRDSGVPREDIFVTTKLPPEQAGRERETIAASLAALDTGYVDLWLIHWPPSQDRASIASWRELLAVRDEGLVRTVGVSNYSTGQLDMLIEATEEAPAVNQIRWGPVLHDPRRLDEHRERGVVLEGYSPLKTTDLDDPVLGEIARGHGVTPGQVVLRWHIDHGIVVIPKSGTPSRIRENVDLFGFSLSDSELRQLDAMGR